MLIAEFGSKHNGCASRYSDRDLLLVSNDWEKINVLKGYYKKTGFSVTPFHIDKAKFLSKNGSLFFKHIIDESVVISDKNDIYQDLSATWTPKRNYSLEIESNVDLLEILHFAPKSKFSINYLLDLMVTSIRNILIRRLAETGKYIFSWENVVRVSFEHGYITYNDIMIISYSRRLKNRYRIGVYDYIPQHLIDG
ncbi:MAG: hypothetical protein ACTH4R_13410, partial [Staphylococcus xylosus]